MSARRAEVVSLESLDTRVTALEGVMEDFKLQMSDVGNEVRANTRLTEEVHGNTAELIEAIGDMRVLGRWAKRFAIFVRYVSFVLGFFVALWVFWKTGSWPK